MFDSSLVFLVFIYILFEYFKFQILIIKLLNKYKCTIYSIHESLFVFVCFHLCS
ncbi:hypothetical protein Hanom_Chr12g01164951 [Helianthus anomalus]